MFTHKLARESIISNENENGKIRKILTINLEREIEPGSDEEKNIANAISEYMIEHSDIDISRVFYKGIKFYILNIND